MVYFELGYKAYGYILGLGLRKAVYVRGGQLVGEIHQR